MINCMLSWKNTMYSAKVTALQKISPISTSLWLVSNYQDQPVKERVRYQNQRKDMMIIYQRLIHQRQEHKWIEKARTCILFNTFVIMLKTMKSNLLLSTHSIVTISISRMQIQVNHTWVSIPSSMETMRLICSQKRKEISIILILMTIISTIKSMSHFWSIKMVNSLFKKLK